MLGPKKEILKSCRESVSLIEAQIVEFALLMTQAHSIKYDTFYEHIHTRARKAIKHLYTQIIETQKKIDIEKKHLRDIDIQSNLLKSLSKNQDIQKDLYLLKNYITNHPHITLDKLIERVRSLLNSGSIIHGSFFEDLLSFLEYTKKNKNHKEALLRVNKLINKMSQTVNKNSNLFTQSDNTFKSMKRASNDRIYELQHKMVYLEEQIEMTKERVLMSESALKRIGEELGWKNPELLIHAPKFSICYNSKVYNYRDEDEFYYTEYICDINEMVDRTVKTLQKYNR